jgi:Ni/Co efflux regulator RcnB
MKTNAKYSALLTAVTLALGLASTQAMAGGQGHGNGHANNGKGHASPVQDDSRDRRYHEQSGHWDNGRRGPPPWAKGRDYRSYGYGNVVIVGVPEYDRYRLYAPRQGYRWVRDDAGHYMLVSIASGIISDILYRNGL